jgi:hypothetical protein
VHKGLLVGGLEVDAEKHVEKKARVRAQTLAEVLRTSCRK